MPINARGNLTPMDLWYKGWEIVKDAHSDHYRFRARFWTEESGLCDTPDLAAAKCRELIMAPVEP